MRTSKVFFRPKVRIHHRRVEIVAWRKAQRRGYNYDLLAERIHVRGVLDETGFIGHASFYILVEGARRLYLDTVKG